MYFFLFAKKAVTFLTHFVKTIHAYVVSYQTLILILFSGLPITFLLGFYVSLVVKRWWEQYCKLPWPDTIAIFVKGLVVGAPGEKSIRARMVRRTVIRYCLLAYILCIRRLSSRLKKRFTTMQELVKMGL